MSLYGFYLVVIYCDTLYLIIQYVKGKPIEKIVSPITWLIADNKLMKILLHYEDDEATLFYNHGSIFAFVISCLWTFLLIPVKYINFVGILCMILVYIIALIVLILGVIVAIREKNIEKRNKKRRMYDWLKYSLSRLALDMF